MSYKFRLKYKSNNDVIETINKCRIECSINKPIQGTLEYSITENELSKLIDRDTSVGYSNIFDIIYADLIIYRDDVSYTIPVTVSTIDKNTMHSTHTIKMRFTANTEQSYGTKLDGYVAGTSVEVLDTLFKSNGYSVQYDEKLVSNDRMVYLYSKGFYWNIINNIIDKSFILNDYLYYSNDIKFKDIRINSFSNSYLNGYDTIAFKSDADSKFANNKSIDNIYNLSMYSTIISTNDIFVVNRTDSMLNTNINNLFPDISIQGIVDYDVSGIYMDKVRSVFYEFLDCIGDTSYKDILTKFKLLNDGEVLDSTTLKNITNFTTKLNNKTDLYTTNIIQSSSTNTHKYYPIADYYRKYFISTFNKEFVCRYRNDLGPDLGSNIYNVVENHASPSNVDVFNYDYCGRYIVVEKIIDYDIKGEGNSTSGNNPILTTVKMIGKNYKAPNIHKQEVIAELNKMASKGTKK